MEAASQTALERMLRLGIRGLGHVAYRVRNYERSLAWYIGVLGFQEVFRLEREDGKPHIIYLRIKDDHFIELFEEPEGGQVEVPRLGMQHLCLHVDDMTSTLQELATRGLQGASEPRFGKAGALQCWITDPDGNRIELMELVPGCLHLSGNDASRS